jgi:hypothetical protein
VSSYGSATNTGVTAHINDAVRPRTLSIAVWSGLVGAFGALAWGILLLAKGKDLIRPAIQDYAQQIGGDLLSSGALGVNDLVDAAYQPFQSRAAIWIVLGVLGIAIAALLAGARNWARVILTLIAVSAVGLAVRDLTDIGPGLLKLLDVVAAIGFAAALVCQWLPASNAAIRARKKG